MKLLSIKKLLLLPAFLCTAAMSYGQLKLPQISTTQTITQDLGLGKVTLVYSRPNVKGRKIFGNLVPYNDVWRTGANTATVITFEDDVTIGGAPVPAGEYGLFTIPTAKDWTIILSKKPKQWGSYNYNKEDDQLRFTVSSEKIKPSVESFTMQFSNASARSVTLNLMWDKTAVSFPISTNPDAKSIANIEAAMLGAKKPYMQAVQYYYENNLDIAKALEWVNAAEAAQPKSFSVKLWKSRVQLRSGDKSGAALTARQGIDLAQEAKNAEYIRLNGMALAEAKRSKPNL